MLASVQIHGWGEMPAIGADIMGIFFKDFLLSGTLLT
jgi:hypothetical protein